ncbi:MAG: polymer-forming cytoskeletal protein [Alphaproteobacteria bacterium]|nr:polymer-forming cytoskeletal protein [Alphaproteobacteria bacterium]MBU6471352.1 polymer-forming cytoskeletal protein [Alphaproteobacteria bacterium]MDE2011339.1 polymer-forming cytoskeletal protein [Alphaproteobacteria bacterium]MDE2074083.1 polymer-forming cytoskeletal protein [Alphaproteobacteria bacterium]MDE2350248.1 polymer-forming cytoskeletal protein [Alphaproteobacteria bacterium]
MFSSKSKNTEQQASAAAAQAAAQAGQLKRGAKSASAPSLISADLVVNGTLTSTGDIQIDGRVEGDVHSSGLVIGDKAFINGEVVADDVTVRGRVQGGIRARKVLLAATCHVEGNILHEAFAVEAGAFFEGNCRHSDNPLAEEAPRSTVIERKPVASAPAAPRPAETAAPRPAPAAQAASFAPLKSGG